MTEISQIWLDAEQMINDFKKEFIEKFGVTITISYRLGQYTNLPPLGLQDVLDEVSDLFKEQYPEYINKSLKRVNVTEGLNTKTRIREVVVFRQLYFYICKELGYGSTEIARMLAITKEHSNVIHGCKVIDDGLKTKDIFITNTYKIICNRLENKYGKLKL
jgi:hypothetical protein